MMVMIMMEEVAKSVILFMRQFLNIKVHQLIFTNALIRTTKLKLVKETDIFRLGSSKTKQWNNYNLLLTFNK